MKDLKLSVLLAVYNGEKYIKKSVESVLNQTFQNLELLVGFNGTIDKSKNIVSEFLQDSRLKVFDYGMDSGKSKTINKLLKESTGNWIAIQDDDDIWLPKKVEEQMKFVDECEIIGTQILYINENDEIIGSPKLSYSHDEILSKSLNGDNQIANTSAIFSKNKAMEVNGWDESLDGIEDFDFWLKMMKTAGCTAINLKDYHVWHRLHNKSNFNTKTFDLQSITKKYK